MSCIVQHKRFYKMFKGKLKIIFSLNHLCFYYKLYFTTNLRNPDHLLNSILECLDIYVMFSYVLVA